MGWAERYFSSDDYLLLEGVPCQELIDRIADFICNALEIGSGSRVLDVGCGMGRHGLALARRGCQVTGIDASATMIDRCRPLTDDEPRFAVRQLNFHTMTFEAEFDAVVCLGNTLGFGARADDAEAVRRMAASLVPGGSILIDLHNLAWYRQHMVGRTWWEEADAYALSDIEYDPADQKLVTRDVVVPKDGTPAREYQTTLLEYQPSEIERLVESVGLGEVTFYGDAGASDDGPIFSRDGYNEQSHVMIVTARKRP